jgi:putative ABC transport system substrate-binding protein
VTSLNAELVAKRLGVFRDLVPEATRYFMLVNPASVLAAPFTTALQSAAGSIGFQIEVRTIPTIFDDRAYVSAGGLVCYGADFLNVMELAGNYAGRILKGERPGNLPVQQPTKFELVINLKTAKALGIDVPQRLLLIADEAIE